MDDEFDFGYVEFGLMRHCITVWQTDSTGLNIYKDVRVCITNLEVIVQDSGNRWIYAQNSV